MTTRRMGIGTLMAKKITPTRHIVAGVVPVGLTLLASRPKLGKSWMVFDLAISVAAGRTFLDRPTEAGDVLYWALEDSEDRLQSRAVQLVGEDEIHHRLDIESVGSRITPDSAYEDMEDWLSEVENPKLIIIDTLKKIRKSRSGMGGGYDQDYDFGDKLQKLAHKHSIAIVLVYHTTKAVREDFIDEVQDTTGMTAVPDNVVVMRRKRGQTEAELHMAPKDFNEAALRIQHNQETGRWDYLGELDGNEKNNRPELRQKIINLLATKDTAQSPTQIANETSIALVSLRTYLRRMVDYGELLNPAYGQYTLSDSVREELGLEKLAPPAPEGVTIKRRPVRKGGRQTSITKNDPESKYGEYDQMSRDEVRELLSPAAYKAYAAGRNDRRREAGLVAKKTSVPKKTVRPRKVAKPSVPMVRALKSKWTKPLSEVAAMPTMTLFSMNKNGEFSEDDFDAIQAYREEQRQKAVKGFDTTVARKVAPIRAKKAVRPSQRAREHNDEDTKEAHTRRVVGTPKKAVRKR